MAPRLVSRLVMNTGYVFRTTLITLLRNAKQLFVGWGRLYGLRAARLFRPSVGFVASVWPQGERQCVPDSGQCAANPADSRAHVATPVRYEAESFGPDADSSASGLAAVDRYDLAG
jgi:hypothetical protein